MSEEKDKKYSWPGEFDAAVGERGMEQQKAGQTASRLRRINPLGMRVVIRIRRDENRTDTGLYLPEGAKQSMQDSLLGEVLEVASAMDDDTHEETNISGVPQGSLVIIRKDTGVKVPWDDDLRIVETKDVLAIVSEVSVS